MEFGIWTWVGFNLVVLLLLTLDLGVFHRKAHAVSIKEAALWSAFWIALSLLFNLVLFFWQGSTIALEFLAGYLIEKSLSIDNIFVFVVLFRYFSVPPAYQHRVLFWGIIGALVMRGVMIFLGAALLSRFEWILLLFGVFLIFTGVRMGLQKEDDEQIQPDKNFVVRMARKVLPVTLEFRGQRLFVREHGRLMATPLFITLLVVESTDLLFAVDSIPAIFAVTLNPFIVYTSNVCAILGLRSLYFLLAGVMDKFHYLKHGLAVVLSFVGVKMLTPELSHWLTGVTYKIPITVSLTIIAGTLTVATMASLVRERMLVRQAAQLEEAGALADPATQAIPD
jgi:tellurite resistance protein TerC